MQRTCARDLMASAIILASGVADTVEGCVSVVDFLLCIILLLLGVVLLGVRWSKVWWNLSHLLQISSDMQDRRSWLLARQFSQYRCLSTISCLSLTDICKN